MRAETRASAQDAEDARGLYPRVPAGGAGVLAHPAFDAVSARGLDRALIEGALAGLQALADGCGVVNARGDRLVLVETVPGGAAAYERAVMDHAALAVRADTWHDRFNVASWCLFPKAKAALNAAHVADLAGATSGERSRLRDALTLFDEDGAVVAVADPRIEDAIRGFRWREAFIDRRAAVEARAMCVPFGHALMEKLLDPFLGLTAKALFVPVPEDFPARSWSARLACLDEALSRMIGALRTPRDLAPLPILGWPGWHPDNADAVFYDNVQYFRPGRTTRAR